MRTATCIAAITLLGVTTLPAQEHDPDQGVAGAVPFSIARRMQPREPTP